MDFITERPEGVHPFSLRNVLVDFNRGVLGIEVDFSLPAERIVRAMKQIIECRGAPDQGRQRAEYFSGTLMDCAEETGITLSLI